MDKEKRIVLRQWTEKDLSTYKYWHEGNHNWMKFNGPYYPVKTISEVIIEVENIWKIKENSNSLKVDERLVIADQFTNNLIGTVGRYWQSKETNWLSIGITIFDDKYWSRGIGFDALSLWIDYLFNKMPEIVRLDLRTWSGNYGMMKLAEKLGFKLEARFRNARMIDGEYYDSLGYGILREEWKSNDR